MNRRVLTILVVAFAIALACTFLVIRLMQNQTKAVKPPATTLVVAAKTNIKLGAILTADNLTTIEITGTTDCYRLRRRTGGHHPPRHESLRRQS